MFLAAVSDRVRGKNCFCALFWLVSSMLNKIFSSSFECGSGEGGGPGKSSVLIILYAKQYIEGKWTEVMTTKRHMVAFPLAHADKCQISLCQGKHCYNM